jgi:hypothetical protein
MLPMREYVFRFGFESPSEFKQNNECNTDFESSQAFAVIAENPEAALSWGREVAELWTAKLFLEAGFVDVPSWKAGNYAHWIDHNPQRDFSSAELGALLRTQINIVPDFSAFPSL